jgi:hypothetical protein
VGCIGRWHELQWVLRTNGQFNGTSEWRRAWARTFWAEYEKWKWAGHLDMGTERHSCDAQPSNCSSCYAWSTNCSSGDEESNGCQQSRGCVWEGVNLGWTEFENGLGRCVVQMREALMRRIFKVQIRSNIIRYVATTTIKRTDPPQVFLHIHHSLAVTHDAISHDSDPEHGSAFSV